MNIKPMFFILFFCVPFLASGQQENLLVSNDWETIHQTLNLRKPDNSNRFESDIESSISKINNAIGYNIKCWISDKGPIFSHPDFGIVLNIEELRKIFQESKTSSFQSVMSLIIAHEIAHQLQFKVYGANSILQNCKEMKKVYECQADILAGAMLVNISDNGYDEIASINALRVLYNIGTPEYSFSASHPSHEDRRLAVSMGINVAKSISDQSKVFSLRKSLPHPGESKLRGILNIENGENVMTWSLRQAKRIVNYCMVIAKMS